MPDPNLASKTDEELIAAVAQRDADAFEEVYDRYAPLLYAISLRILRQAADAQDLISEVFWEVWDRADRFNPNRGLFRTYLLTLVRSRAIDRLRSDSGRRSHEKGFFEELVADGSSSPPNCDPVHIVISDETNRLVSAAMEGLSTVQRRALQLAYFEGLTHREIAEKMDTPLGTIKTHIRQALIKLGQALRSTGAHETGR